MAESRKQGASISAILASTAASISVCLLLVVLADDQPAVMLDWGRLQESQMMGAYNLARRAGDAQLVKADATLSAPVVKASKSAAPQKLSSMQQAVNELKHLKKIANDVWPSGASKHHKLAQSSTQMLAHYKQLSSDAWPSHAAAHGKRSAQTAEQELAELKKVSSLGLPSSKSSTHSSWHQTAHDLFAHYKSITSKSLPDTVAEKKKTAMSAEQELAHYKKLSSEIWPSEHSAVQHKESAHEMLAHYKAVTDATSPSHSVQTKARVAKLSASGHLAASHVRPHSPHAKSQKLSRTIAGGLEITDVTEGTGPEPKVGDKITVHYTGKLTSGKVFDSGDISFQFGEGQVIKGWDIGLDGMKEGGERKLVIPSGLAYGSRGTPGGPIPPDATLDFDVKLLKV